MFTVDNPVLTAIADILAEREDVELVLAFGSRARGSAGTTSDLDLAISAPKLDLLELQARIQTAVDCPVDVVALADAELPLLRALVDEGVVVHEGTPGAAARWRFHALLTLETDGPAYQRMSEAFLRTLANR